MVILKYLPEPLNIDLSDQTPCPRLSSTNSYIFYSCTLVDNIVTMAAETMSDFKIRKAKEEDCEDIVRLIKVSIRDVHICDIHPLVTRIYIIYSVSTCRDIWWFVQFTANWYTPPPVGPLLRMSVTPELPNPPPPPPQSDQRFCKNEGSKRSKINENGAQFDW